MEGRKMVGGFETASSGIRKDGVCGRCWSIRYLGIVMGH